MLTDDAGRLQVRRRRRHRRAATARKEATAATAPEPCTAMLSDRRKDMLNSPKLEARRCRATGRIVEAEAAQV